MFDKLTIYGYASGCPACDNLKALLDNLGVQYDFIAIGPESRERAILRDAGYDTLPQAFEALTGRSLGGYSDFRKVARLGLQAGGMLG